MATDFIALGDFNSPIAVGKLLPIQNAATSPMVQGDLNFMFPEDKS
jgi:hypothetical protein